MEKHTPILKSLLDDIFEGMAENYTKLFPLHAIWLERYLQTSTERKRRITSNDLVCVQKGNLIDCKHEPTHKILRIRGNLANTVFEIDLLNLITKEEQTIQL